MLCETRLVRGRNPHVVPHTLLVRVVVVGVRAGRSPQGRVLVVHAVLLLVLRLGVDIAVVCTSGRGQGLLGWRLPAHGRHVWASIGTVCSRLVVVCSRGGFKDLWRAVLVAWVRGDGRP